MSTGTGPEETLRLEGFADSLRGHRVYCVTTTAASQKHAQTFLKGRVAMLDAEVAHRGRKVLVFQGLGAAPGAAAPPKWLLHMGWDVVYHVRDMQDMKLALTVIQHASKPTRVVWFGQEPPVAAFQVLQKLEHVSLLAVGERLPACGEWDAVFWTPDVRIEDLEQFVQARFPGRRVALRPILKELRASEVGLVWSSIGESEKQHGEFYWYDPSEGNTGTAALDIQEAAETLRAVADLLVKH